MRVSRREAIAAGLPLLAAGCGRIDPRQTTLRFWNGFTGPDGRTMLRLVEQFNKANTDVSVLMQRMDWATYYNKLFVAGLGGRAPEVFVLQTHAVPRFALARFVRPIDDLMSGQIDANDFAPNILRSVTVDGKRYGLPLDIWPMGMYVNRRLLRDAGIASPPTTRDEFINTLVRVRKLSRPGDERWGFVFTNFESNLYSIMRQFGGEFFSPAGKRCVMDNPENAVALTFCHDLIWKQGLAPKPENFDAWIGFRQGRVALAFEGIYMLADLRNQSDLDFAGAPIPLLGTKRATWTGSHNLCLLDGLEPSRLSAAWRFVKFLSDNSLDWAEGGQIPARRSLRETARFKAMTVQAAFATEVPYAVYMPQVPFAFEFMTEFDLAIERVLDNTAAPGVALADAMSHVNAIIARDMIASAPTSGSRA